MHQPPSRRITRTALVAAAMLLLSAAISPACAGDWSLKARDGTRYTLSGLQGKWVLVNFWAPWCPPCLDEMPGFAQLQSQHKNLQIIGVAVMYHSRQDVLDAAAKQAIPYPIVFGNEDIASDFGELHGLPTSYLFSPTGKLVSRFEGPANLSKLEALMAQH